MVKKKKKSSESKIVTNQGLFETEVSEAKTFELEQEEAKAIRRYIG